MTFGLEVVEGTTLDAAWRAAVGVLLAAPSHRLSNLVVRVASPQTTAVEFGAALDDALDAAGAATVRAVARTIVPRAIIEARDWERAAGRMRDKLPRDSYFRRMIDYEDDGGSVNQIREVIGAMNHRRPDGGRWADPGPIVLERPGRFAIARVGFPCLSQVQFHRRVDELVATAVYRSHYYHEKAYGNFVGLARLQRLVARESHLSPGELMIVSTDARLERIGVMRQLVAA